MIRMILRKGVKPIVVLGLEPDNIRRLLGGEPVKVNLRGLDPDGPPMEDMPDVDVLIGSTDTEDWRRFMAKVDEQEGRRRDERG